MEHVKTRGSTSTHGVSGWGSIAARPGAFLLVVMIAMLIPAASAAPGAGFVILVHGLWRSSHSMEPMAESLEKEGFTVLNVEYESRKATIEALSEETIGPALDEARKAGAEKVDFVTHSLGGILVRSYFSRHPADIVGRVVMLGPPNKGSEAVDAFDELPWFDEIMGPAGRELGTEADSVPNSLGKPPFQLGVIAGNRSFNPVESAVIPGPDDSKVSVERTKVDGMIDHIVVDASHPFLMRSPEAIRQAIHFLKFGRFDHPETHPKGSTRPGWKRLKTGR